LMDPEIEDECRKIVGQDRTDACSRGVPRSVSCHSS
jgi:hypothetical protein